MYAYYSRVCRLHELPLQTAMLSENASSEKFREHQYEAARDVARALAKTEPSSRSRRDRKKVEMLFAHLKRILRWGGCDCGGQRAQFEFTFAAIAQNLKRLAKLVARPPPVTSKTI